MPHLIFFQVYLPRCSCSCSWGWWWVLRNSVFTQMKCSTSTDRTGTGSGPVFSFFSSPFSLDLLPRVLFMHSSILRPPPSFHASIHPPLLLSLLHVPIPPVPSRPPSSPRSVKPLYTFNLLFNSVCMISFLHSLSSQLLLPIKTASHLFSGHPHCVPVFPSPLTPGNQPPQPFSNENQTSKTKSTNCIHTYRHTCSIFGLFASFAPSCTARRRCCYCCLSPPGWRSGVMERWFISSTCDFIVYRTVTYRRHCMGFNRMLLRLWNIITKVGGSHVQAPRFRPHLRTKRGREKHSFAG